MLLIAASDYSRMVSNAGLPDALADPVRGALGFVFGCAVIIVLMGMIGGSTLIMVPIATPIAQEFFGHFGVNTDWMVEIGRVMPPLGHFVVTGRNTLNGPDATARQSSRPARLGVSLRRGAIR